jgi:hypothetical protein
MNLKSQLEPTQVADSQKNFSMILEKRKNQLKARSYRYLITVCTAVKVMILITEVSYGCRFIRVLNHYNLQCLSIKMNELHYDCQFQRCQLSSYDEILDDFNTYQHEL